MVNMLMKLLAVVFCILSKSFLIADPIPEIPILAQLIAPIPQTGVDGSGNVIAIWKEIDNEKNTTIKSSVFSKKGSWSKSVNVSSSSS